MFDVAPERAHEEGVDALLDFVQVVEHALVDLELAAVVAFLGATDSRVRQLVDARRDQPEGLAQLLELGVFGQGFLFFNHRLLCEPCKNY